MRRLAIALCLTIPLLAAEAVPGWLGVGYVYHKPGAEGWMLVQHGLPNGPAAQAGLRPRDVITRIDGKPLTARGQYGVMQLLRNVRPGQKVRLTVRRGDQTLPMIVTAAKMTAAQERLWRDSLDYERSRTRPR